VTVRLLDRFTRDDVSAKVWWPVALVGVVALVLSVPLGNRAVDQTRRDAAARAAAASVAVIQPLGVSGATPAQMSDALQSLVADDADLVAVRVWDPSHLLVASSVRGDRLGSGEALNDADIDRALSEGSASVVTDRLPTGDEGPTTYYAYTLIDGRDGRLVTQFEAREAVLLADVHHDWLWLRIILLVATLLLFGLALLSMRDPVAPIGAGVAFYPESVPPSLRVMDAERAIELEQAGERAKDRLAGLQHRLDESERLRLKAEGQLQQMLTARGSGGAMPMPTTEPVVIPEAAPAPVARAPKPEAEAPKPVTPLVMSPTPEAAAAAVAAAAATKRSRKRREEPVVSASVSETASADAAPAVVARTPKPAVGSPKPARTPKHAVQAPRMEPVAPKPAQKAPKPRVEAPKPASAVASACRAIARSASSCCVSMTATTSPF
jgi:hypothetical protein